MRPYRCVKCGQSHKTSDCEKRDRNTPAMCALCKGPHPANYKGCEVYKEILARKRKRYNDRTDKPLDVQKTMEEHLNQFQPVYDTRKITNNNGQTKGKSTYAETTKKNIPRSDKQINTNTIEETTTNTSLEYLLLKQNEKFDLILQQMSTLMSLIVKLVERLSQ